MIIFIVENNFNLQIQITFGGGLVLLEWIFKRTVHIFQQWNTFRVTDASCLIESSWKLLSSESNFSLGGQQLLFLQNLCLVRKATAFSQEAEKIYKWADSGHLQMYCVKTTDVNEHMHVSCEIWFAFEVNKFVLPSLSDCKYRSKAPTMWDANLPVYIFEVKENVALLFISLQGQVWYMVSICCFYYGYVCGNKEHSPVMNRCLLINPNKHCFAFLALLTKC